eukprot:gene12245-2880_t
MRTVRSSLPDAGLKIGGMNISNKRYADDTTLLEDDKRKLEELVEAVRTESLGFGLKINEAKTNVMTLNGSGQVKLGDVEIETVDEFKYLGSMLDIDTQTSHEIKLRLAVAKRFASDLHPI